MKNPKPTWQYVQGVLAAQTLVATVTGKQKIDGMSDREWKLISDLHIALAELGSAAVLDYERARS